MEEGGVMDDIVVSLIIVVITAAGIIALFVYLGQKKKHKQQALEQAAKENGWLLERVEKPLLSGYRVSGRMMEGNWTLEALAKASSNESGPGSSEVSKTTEWVTTDLTNEKGAFVFGPAMGPVSRMSNSALGSTIIQMALRIMIGKDAEWVNKLSQVDIPHSILGKKFLAFTDNEKDITQLITPAVEKAVINLPGKMEPIIIWNQSGLAIKVINQNYENPEVWKALIEFGKTLLREWSRIDQ
jgi:hypothetical protein